MSYYETHKEQWARYRANRIARLGGIEAFRADNMERTRKYRTLRRDHHLAKRRVAYAANAEREKKRQRTYYGANREAVLARQSERHARDPQKYRDRVAAAYTRKRHALGVKDYSTRMGLNTQYANRRRAKRAGNGGSHTLQEWRDKCSLLGNVCFYCGEAKPLTRDHKMPLHRGGTDDIMNILPACRSCNSHKRLMTASEYIATRRAA